MFRNRVSLTLIGGAAALLVAAAILITTAGGGLPSKIILHFEGERGVTLFGGLQNLWQMWGIGTAGVAIDVALAAMLFRRDRVLCYTLAGAAPVVGLLLFIAVGTIISIN